MPILLNQISMAYGHKLLFADVNLQLNDNSRYALVGANGVGKSSLLRLLTGEETPDEGSISLPKDAITGWLKQDQFRYEETRIVDVVLQGKPALWQALIDKEKLLKHAEWTDEMGYKLGALEETIAHYDGYNAEGFAQKLLTGLGIDPQYHFEPLKLLSGGYKLRVLLAQALFQQPDILLLDEPTNHLDIVSIDWLEKYLRTEYKGLLVFISHDKEFINKLAQKILDIDYGEIREYSGKYELFLSEKQLIIDQQLHIKKNMEDKIALMQRFVDRFRASPTRARQAQSRIKMIEKMEVPDIQHSSRVAPHFGFKQKRPSGKKVLEIKNIHKSFGDKQVLRNVNLTLHRGEKIAVIGANGAGKSTLLKILLGKIQADIGEFAWGHEVQTSYFSQEHHELLTESESVLSWLEAHCSKVREQEARRALGQMLFTQDDVSKNILNLSGGEAARLLLAKMMLEDANVILLDEPTNHLDIETTDALAKALADYPGTVILVSHNRDFINKIATRVLVVGAKITAFKGNYAAYEETLSK